MVSEPCKTCDSGSVCGQFSSLDLVCFGFSVSKPFCYKPLGFKEEQWLTLVESEVFEGILRFDGRKLEEVSHHHQLQPTEVAWRVWWFTEKCLGFVNGSRDGKTSQILAAMYDCGKDSLKTLGGLKWPLEDESESIDVNRRDADSRAAAVCTGGAKIF
eukprot:Gb_31676 [translate_table: standard]